MLVVRSPARMRLLQESSSSTTPAVGASRSHSITYPAGATLHHLPHFGSMSRTLQYKKITKPLLERKRRARINRCLDELKELMVGAFEAEGENVNKLEKADILELTVRHLQKLHETGRLAPQSSDATSHADAAEEVITQATRFQAGFSHCAGEAVRFLLCAPGLDVELGRRLVQHLASASVSASQQQQQQRATTRRLPPGHRSSMWRPW